MKFLNIFKDSIENVMDEGLNNAVYKLAECKITDEEPAGSKITVGSADEIIKKNTNKMKQSTMKNFSDKLFKGESNGKI